MVIENRTSVVIVITGGLQRWIKMRELRNQYIHMSMEVHPEIGGRQKKTVSTEFIHKISVSFDI